MIHRFWMGDPPAYDFKKRLEEIHQAPVTDWTPENLPDDMKHLTSMSQDPRRVSNLVRASLLLRFGGLWVDHDLQPLADLMSSKSPWTASLRGRREGCAMWFPSPGHPMLVDVLRQSMRTPDMIGAHALQESGHRNVRHENRVIPFDANRCPQPLSGRAMAVHHWATSKVGS